MVYLPKESLTGTPEKCPTLLACSFSLSFSDRCDCLRYRSARQTPPDTGTNSRQDLREVTFQRVFGTLVDEHEGQTPRAMLISVVSYSRGRQSAGQKVTSMRARLVRDTSLIPDLMVAENG
jgi:hypothetical protein